MSDENICPECGWWYIDCNCEAKRLKAEAAFWKERAERLKHTLEQFDHHPLAKDTLQAHTQAIEEREKAK